MSETLLLDYAWARPTPATIKAAGYSGAMRYLSHDPTKNLSKAEAAGLLAAGLSIGLVWETTASRASAGFAAGVSDALTAEAQATALGYPSTAVLFYAVDYDATPAAVGSYFAGITSKARRPVGVYGGIRIVDGVNAPWKWQASAWSGGKISVKAHLYQRLHATVPKPIAATDENVVLRPFPMWTTTSQSQSIPPLEDDMPLTQADADLVVKRLLGTEVSPGLVVKTVLQRAAAASPTIDTAALVAAIVALIPNGVALSEQDVSAAAEAAIRKVLGTLDGAS